MFAGTATASTKTCLPCKALQVQIVKLKKQNATLTAQNVTLKAQVAASQQGAIATIMAMQTPQLFDFLSQLYDSVKAGQFVDAKATSYSFDGTYIHSRDFDFQWEWDTFNP